MCVGKRYYLISLDCRLSASLLYHAASIALDLIANHLDYFLTLQEVAYEEDQKYKEGKFILEKARIKHAGNWGS